MTKQEWIKRIEILMLTGRDCFGGCEEYGCTDCQDKAKEVYEGIEQDLLKEFVEYVIKQHTTEGGQKLVIFHQVLLDNLENFIKEREK